VLTESLDMKRGLVVSRDAFSSESPWLNLRFRELPEGCIVQTASSTNIGTGIREWRKKGDIGLLL
jgi:hypothetical protein